MDIFYLFFFVFLQLSKKAQLNNRVKLIDLAKAGNQIKDNQKCSVAGWGFTKTGGKIVDDLEVVDVPLVNLNVCKKKWKEFNVNLPASVICAGGINTNKGFCQVCFLFSHRKYQQILSLNGF